MSQIQVRKYGGSCLLNPQRIKETASQLAKEHKAGQQFIVVVSAMGQTTNELLSLAHHISPSPSRRELDMLLSAGERISMTLMSMALHELQCPAISFTGSQAGVLTDSSHSGAQIIDVKPIRIDEAVQQNQIVVLAGFQGVDPKTKEVTTLGRGGSDTTAVAMAAHYKCSCEIFKDVPGICSSDPKLGFDYKLYDKISYQALTEMCFWGARVLHYKSVSLAHSKKVPLLIKSIQNQKKGTEVVFEEGQEASGQALAVNSHGEVLKLNISSPPHSFFESHRLPCPQILHHDKKNDEYFITDSMENLSAIKFALENNFSSLSSVTLTFEGHAPSQIIDIAMNVLKELELETPPLIHSQSLTVFLQSKHRQKVLKEWHDLIATL